MSSSSSDIKCGVYDVSLPSRAIAPIHDPLGNGDKTQSYFIVGSCAAEGTGQKNQIALLGYQEEKTFVNCVGVMSHSEGEIIKISTAGNASGTDDIASSSGGGAGRFFATTHTSSAAANTSGVTSSVYKLMNSGSEGLTMERVAALPDGCTAVEWNPLKIDSTELRVALGETEIGVISDFTRNNNGSDAIVTTRYTLPTAVSSSSSAVVKKRNGLLQQLTQPTVLSWDPIFSDRIIVGKGTSLYQIDTRSKTGAAASGSSSGGGGAGGTSSSTSLLCGSAHGFGAIRSVHNNRNELNLVVTGGDDGHVSFWDLRKAGNGPLLSHRLHDHWVQKVCFNRMSDKTLLTSSSDRSAKIWGLGSSVPWGASEKKKMGSSLGDINASSSSSTSSLTATSLGDFGDAVMDCCWSSLTPFVTAAVSYNGKVIVGTTNKATRDSIYGIM